MKSVSLQEKLVSLMKAYFFIYIGYFNQFRLEYPIFLPINETFRFKPYVRLTTDSNLLSWGLESLVLMGLELIRDNGGNIFSFVV